MKDKSFLKILILFFYLLILIIILFALVWFFINKKAFNKNLKRSTDLYKKSQIELIETNVNNTLEIIGNFYKSNNSSLKIDQNFLQKIINYKFGKNKNLYLYIIDFNGKMLAHPIKPELINQNLYYLKDEKNKLFVQDIINIAKQKKSGFVEYYWENPSTKKITKKLTYFNSNKNLNIIVCSGIYLEDLIEEYNKAFISLKKINNIKIYANIGFLVLILILIFIIFKKLIIKFQFDFNLIKKFLEKNSEENENIDTSLFTFNESKNIASFINKYINKLNENLTFLKSLFELLPVPLFLETQDKIIVDCNLAVEKLYGFKKEELIGKDLSLIVPDYLLKTFDDKIKIEILDNVFSFEYKNKKKDGTIFPCLVNVTNIKIYNKDYKLVSVIDLTKQKEFEKKLIQEQQKIKKFLDTAPVIMVVMDNKGIVQLINKTGCEILGYKENEIIGQNWFDKFLPDDIKEKRKKFFFKQMKLGSSEIQYYENYIVNSKGKKRLIKWASFYLKDEHGNILGEFGSGEDITDIKNMEIQLQKMKNLESLGILAGGIAHDFNNILTGISANISLLKMQIGKNNSFYDTITDIEKASKKALNLSSQLLTFAKGGTPVLKPESIKEIIKETIGFYTSGSEIKTVIKAPDNLWNVHIDKNQISQVFTNLLLNSIAAIKKNGKITIILSNTKLFKKNFYVKNNILKPGNYVKIIFQDNGKGIPEDILSKIFNPYFTTKKNGNGLGLSIVYSIIKKHNGYIEVESKEGVGTKFTIYLKATLKRIKKENINNKSLSELKEIHSKNKAKSILILEDNTIVQNSFKSILTKLNYDLFISDKSYEIIKKFKELRKEKIQIKFIILDLTIKGSSGGIETAKKLLKIDKNINLIVTTGYYNNSILNNLKKYGFKAYLKKPFTADELIALLEKF